METAGTWNNFPPHCIAVKSGDDDKVIYSSLSSSAVAVTMSLAILFSCHGRQVGLRIISETSKLVGN